MLSKNTMHRGKLFILLIIDYTYTNLIPNVEYALHLLDISSQDYYIVTCLQSRNQVILYFPN